MPILDFEHDVIIHKRRVPIDTSEGVDVWDLTLGKNTIAENLSNEEGAIQLATELAARTGHHAVWLIDPDGAPRLISET